MDGASLTLLELSVGVASPPAEQLFWTASRSALALLEDLERDWRLATIFAELCMLGESRSPNPASSVISHMIRSAAAVSLKSHP